MQRTSIFKIVFASQLVTILITSSLFANKSGLSKETIEQIRSSFEMDGHTRAMYNSITNTDISDLALNRDILQRHNEIFSHKIETKGITNQEKSGRCWLFAGLNIMRPAVIKKYNLEEFEFSQSYLTFWDKLEKANSFLERIIALRDSDIMDRKMELILRMPLSDGGYWENFVNLVGKYGVVPKEVMPETNSSENTNLMNKLISRKLRADATRLRKMHAENKPVEKLREEKLKMLSQVYKMLVMNYGQPPEEFQWRYEDANSVVSEPNTFTPQSFYKEFVDFDLSDYVDIFNDPSKQYGKHYMIDMTANIYDGDNVHFANVEIDNLKEIASKSILDDQPIWFGCDMGKDQDREHGIMAIGMFDYDPIYEIDMDMTKAQRALYRESVPNHAMVFTGIDIRDDKPVKWRVENSWGDEKGSEGHWTLYDKWFDLNVYSIIVKKKYVPEEILKIYKLPPIIVPPWDPMFSFVR